MIVVLSRLTDLDERLKDIFIKYWLYVFKTSFFGADAPVHSAPIGREAVTPSPKLVSPSNAEQITNIQQYYTFWRSCMPLNCVLFRLEQQ